MHRPLRKRKGCACSESRINPTTAVYLIKRKLGYERIYHFYRKKTALFGLVDYLEP